MAKDSIQSKGGKARAQALNPEQRKEIASRAALSRWVPRASHTGTLEIGDMKFPCSVLSDGTRILTQTDFMRGMGMYYSGWVANRKNKSDSADIPHFLAFASLKPFVHRHLGDLQSISVKYQTEKGNLAHGIKAQIIPKICEVWLDADEQGILGKRQRQIARKAKILMRALAHVGIVALVDEATGYQENRAKDELTKILAAYISEELLPWTKTFPDEFFRQVYRLQGWKFKPGSAKRSPYVGKIINQYIYERLPDGVLPKLREKNPVTTKGYRKHKHFQFLTPDTGNVHLDRQITAVTTIMRISDDKRDFENNFHKAFPKKGQQERLPLKVKVGNEEKDV